ncbi:DUF2567 domain-containing protein [Mycobacterium sp. NPDC050551]|uniref:DUF2567 domain-containing protein n=1 Tax=Mycobacterium sp. NPDC050551 TaxID=3155407 RepID=UPI00342A7AA5
MSAPLPLDAGRRRAVLLVIGGLVVTGALVGALWAFLAPPVQGVVVLSRQGERVKAFLGDEADHFFTSAALLVGMLLVVAVVAAVLLWQWRAHRGPVLVAALSVGCGGAAAVAAGVGAGIARLRYGAVDVAAAPVSPEHRVHYVTEAPAVFFGHSPLQVLVTILFPAAVAALVYALLAVSTARDDLGGWPPQDGWQPATDRTGTADDARPVGPRSPSH